jgi:aminopeptidase N
MSSWCEMRPALKRLRPVLLASLLLAVTLACLGGTAVPPTSTPAPPASPTSLPASPTARPNSLPEPTHPPEPTAQATAPLAHVGAAGIGDPYFPKMGNGGYDALHYTIDLNVDVKRDFVDGTMTLEAQATEPLDRFDLDFVGFDVAAIQVDGATATYARDGGELQITPAAELQAGHDFTVTVQYSGVPGSDLPPGTAEYSEGWISYPNGVMVAGEPTGAAGWYPVNEHPLDKAAYTLRITVPQPYEVAANGVLEATETSGDETTYTWQARDPVAPYLVTVAIGDFNLVTATSAGGVPVRNYFAVGVPQRAIHAFDRMPQMVDYYSSAFGPYPFEVAGAVVHNVRLNFALETQTLLLFGADFVDEGVVAHELAHQWFGDSVSLTAWKDIWLNEGFATYASTLWAEHASGKQAADDQIRGYYSDMASGGGPPLLVGDPGANDLFDWAIYARGALTLHALRLKISDEAFFKTLQTYTSRYRHANATTDDFIAVAEEVSGQQLDDLFQAWLFEKDLPDIPEMGLYAKNFASPGG